MDETLKLDISVEKLVELMEWYKRIYYVEHLIYDLEDEDLEISFELKKQLYFQILFPFPENNFFIKKNHYELEAINFFKEKNEIKCYYYSEDELDFITEYHKFEEEDFLRMMWKYVLDRKLKKGEK